MVIGHLAIAVCAMQLALIGHSTAFGRSPVSLLRRFPTFWMIVAHGWIINAAGGWKLGL